MPWFKYAGTKRTLELTFVWSDNRLVAVAPLVTDKVHIGIFSLARTGLATYGGYSPTLDFRLDEKSAPAALNALLTTDANHGGSWDLLSLRQIDGNSAVLKFLPEVVRQLNYGLFWEPARREGILHLSGDWDSYLTRLGRKHRKELVRGDRILENSTEWCVSHEWVDQAHASDRFDDYRRLLEKSWKQSHTDDPPLMTLLKDLFLVFSKRGDLLLSKLENDDGYGAAAVQLRYGKSLFGFHMAYDEACTFRGPGTILLGRAIKYAYQEGLIAYDFSTADPNFHRWCPSYRNTASIYISRQKLLMPILRYILTRKPQHHAQSSSESAGAHPDSKSVRGVPISSY